jgi:hypothetical protein
MKRKRSRSSTQHNSASSSSHPLPNPYLPSIRNMIFSTSPRHTNIPKDKTQSYIAPYRLSYTTHPPHSPTPTHPIPSSLSSHPIRPKANTTAKGLPIPPPHNHQPNQLPHLIRSSAIIPLRSRRRRPTSRRRTRPRPRPAIVPHRSRRRRRPRRDISLVLRLSAGGRSARQRLAGIIRRPARLQRGRGHGRHRRTGLGVCVVG